MRTKYCVAMFPVKRILNVGEEVDPVYYYEPYYSENYSVLQDGIEHVVEGSTGKILKTVSHKKSHITIAPPNTEPRMIIDYESLPF